MTVVEGKEGREREGTIHNNQFDVHEIFCPSGCIRLYSLDLKDSAAAGWKKSVLSKAEYLSIYY